jgi:hypothetical protein
MKRTAWILAALAFAGVVAIGAVTTSVEISQNITKDGLINLMWDFTGDGSGAAVSRTKHPVQGTILKAVYVPDYEYQGQGGTTAGLTVRPVSEYRSHWYEGTALDASVLTFTTDGLSVVSYWPAKEIVSTTELQVEITGALTDDGGGARGRLWMTLLPSPGAGE